MAYNPQPVNAPDSLGIRNMSMGGGSLFNPGMLDSQPKMGAMEMTPDFEAYQNFFKANYNPATGSDQLPGQWAAMTPEQKASYGQSQAPGPTEQMPSTMAPPPNPYGGMTPADALGGGLAQTNPATGRPFGETQSAPGQQPPSWVNETTRMANPLSGIPMGEQYNTYADYSKLPPSAQDPGIPIYTPPQQPAPMPAPAPPTDYAMPPPPPSVTPLSITQPAPGTSNLINQISAPVTQAPTQLPVTSPGVSNLIQQIQAPTTPRPAAQPNRATQQFAQQFRPQPRPMARPQPVMAPRPMAQSVSRVNPPLLPSRPMGRR